MKLTNLVIFFIAFFLLIPYTFAGKTIDLSSVLSNTVVKNGDTLKDSLGGNYKISIANGATVTLDGVIIEGVNDSACSWAGLTCEGDCKIVLKGKNKITGFYEGFPGIFVAKGKFLNIKGDGSLEVGSNGYAAGIGGGHNMDGGDILIEDGEITATGGFGGAGIGGGYKSSIGSINISGGLVMATGGDSAAGIGGGVDGSVEEIIFSSSVPKITAKAGENAPFCVGIGSNSADGDYDVDLIRIGNVVYGDGVGDGICVFQTYEVAFYANGGRGRTIHQSFYYDGVEEELDQNIFTFDGYTFNGWNTKPDGEGDSYADMEKVKNLTKTAGGTVKLYAQWVGNNYSIRFDANGGSGTMENMTIRYGERVALTENTFTREGFLFNGWNTGRNGFGTSYKDKEKVVDLTDWPDAVLKFYAQWIKLLTHSDISIAVVPDQVYTGDSLTPEVVVVDDKTTLVRGKDYVLGYTDNVNAGTGTIIVSGLDKYNGRVTIPFTIDKAESKLVTPPKAVKNLVYTGKAQKLVKAGTAEHGTVLYKLGKDGEYSEKIPTAKKAGLYIVFYMVKGDENHNDVKQRSLTVEIAEKTSIGQTKMVTEQYEMERDFDLKGRKLQGQPTARGAYCGRMKRTE